jgi:hypothetical protein
LTQVISNPDNFLPKEESLNWDRVCLFLKIQELDTLKKFFSSLTFTEDFLLEIQVKSEKVTFKSIKKIDKNEYIKLALNSSRKY